WQSVSSAPVQGNVFDFTDAQHGWVLGETALFRTRDGATTWDDLSSSLP
ncbi:MAG TPA: photosystem II assembly protein, partial [Anaerolineaceae bacterium]|nr:photosystem II assembly protein [Anaerolineaceae bacterium]